MNFQQQQQQQQHQQQDGCMGIVGRRITFQVHPSGERYTGLAQEVLTLNGDGTILLNTGESYHLFRMVNMYGICFVEDECPVSCSSPMHPTSPASSSKNNSGSEDEDSDADDDDETECSDESDNVDAFPDTPFIPARSNRCAQLDCPICLEPINMARDAASSECGHQFHLSCLIQNMGSLSPTRENCPLCRASLLPGYSVCSDRETAQRMIQAVLETNHELQLEIEAAERLRTTLTDRLQSTLAVRNQLAQQDGIMLHAALELLDRNALASNLYARIAGVVASAANNDIRENYYDVHEDLEDTIRTICFDFTLFTLGAHAHAPLDNENDDENALLTAYGGRQFPIVVE